MSYQNKGMTIASATVGISPQGNYHDIQDGIDYVEGEGGGDLHLLRGTHVIPAPLDIDDLYLSLRGEGKASIIYLDDDVDDNMIEMTGVAKWFQEISNLKLDGNKANNAAGEGIYIDHTYGTTDAHVDLHHLWIENVEDDGVHIVSGTGTREVHIDRVVVSFAGHDSFRIGGTDHKMTFCTGENPQRHNLYSLTSGIYYGNKMFGSGKAGFGHNFYFTTIPYGQLIIGDCWSQDGNDNGLMLENVDRAQVSCFESDGDDDRGVYLSGTSELNTLDNIHCFDRATGGVHNYGMRLDVNTFNNIFTGGILQGSVAGFSDAGVNNRCNRYHHKTGAGAWTWAA